MEQQQEYTVTLPNSKEGTATIDEHGGILLNNGSFTESHSFTSLVNKARRNTLPEWTRQIPGLVSKIEAVFSQEQRKGIDPFVRFANSDGKLTATDLRAGTSLAAPMADLKKLLRAGKPLPKAFASPQARKLIDLAA